MRLTSQERKKQIINATLKLAAQKGISRITTAEIAKEVGLSEGAIFKHYPNKQEIIRAVVEMVQDSIIGKAHRVDSSPLTAREKLKELLRFHLSFLGQNPGIPRVIFSEQMLLADKELKENMRNFLKLEYLQIIKNIFEQGVAEDVFRGDLDREMIILNYVGLIQSSCYNWSLEDYTWDITESWQKIYNYLIAVWGKV
ncbi:transcriptional regulator, TetR family [Desulfofarcimen acetoxidans DSM 771]|uniref:Transcriptional regulator, TetR family n=1 Tax=Desulfofarcimen acetoxidans (strain ATCC 49208 / DSM 771 / KCTC 5769 / VKM B-1644 / 5575) TaxID=485916 RepID=C8W5Y5_DESAS|nr:TetR/AcrR family transcriptional regulator [Desulfofarcimen acetoxidans]ACV61440.1 transcriptional regulator, TetR family [Desulfofarcimen acetoxidans DSM 771]